MIDDLETYLEHWENPEYKRLGESAFSWIFQRCQNDRQILSVWSICYMLGCNVDDLRKHVISRQEHNDKLRARVIKSNNNEFSITEIKHNKDSMPVP
jgi:hypothetical protein